MSEYACLLKQISGEAEPPPPPPRYAVRKKCDMPADEKPARFKGLPARNSWQVLEVLEGWMTPEDVGALMGIQTETARKRLNAMVALKMVKRKKVKVMWRFRLVERYAYKKVQQEDRT